MYTMVDNTEVIAGAGIVKEQIIQPSQSRHFSVYGSLYGKLTPERIQSISAIAGGGVNTFFMKNPILRPYADFFGELCNAVLNVGLNALKKLSGNREVVSVCEYIIKLMNYCRLDLPEESNFTTDSDIESWLSAFPISRERARDIYAFSNPRNFDDISSRKIEFDNFACQNIGYILFYMFQSRGIDYMVSKKVHEAYEFLSICEGDIQCYKDDYEKNAEDNYLHVKRLKEIFNSADFEKFDINPRFVHKTLRKLDSYYPVSGSRAGKMVLQGAKSFSGIYIEKNPDAAIELLAGGLRMVLDGSKGNRDNIVEEYMSGIKKDYGSDMESSGDRIYKSAKDYEEIIYS